MSARAALSLLVLVCLLSLLVAGCDDDPVTVAGSDDESTCQGCHTNEQMLKSTALPDPPPPEDEGEG